MPNLYLRGSIEETKGLCSHSCFVRDKTGRDWRTLPRNAETETRLSDSDLVAREILGKIQENFGAGQDFSVPPGKSLDWPLIFKENRR